MKSSYDVEVFSLPTGEECGFWYDVWRKYSTLFKGTKYELKEENYFMENPMESGDEFGNALHLVRQKDICNKMVPVLRKAPL